MTHQTYGPTASYGGTGRKVFYEVATTSDTAVELLVANGRRASCEIQNLGTTDLWIADSDDVSPTHGFKVIAGTSYYDPHSTDSWFGYQASADGDVRILEVTQ